MLFALRCSLFARKHLNTETRQHINSSLSVPQCPPCLSGKNALRFTLFAVRKKTPKYGNTSTVISPCASFSWLSRDDNWWKSCSLFDAGSTQVTKTRQNLNSSLSVPWCPRVLVVKCFTLYAVRCTHENTETREHVKTLTQVLVYLSALRVLVVKCFSLYAVRYLHEWVNPL